MVGGIIALGRGRLVSLGSQCTRKLQHLCILSYWRSMWWFFPHKVCVLVCVFVVSLHRGCMCDLTMLGVVTADAIPQCVVMLGYEGYV